MKRSSKYKTQDRMEFMVGFVVIISLLDCGAALDNKTMEKTANVKKMNPRLIQINFSELWPDIRNDKEVILLEQVLEEIEGGRGKSHKHKKLTKTLYPLFMGVLIAKVVLIPLILKMLIAVSSAALVMSKIALITTGLLALKWIFSGPDANGEKDNTHFELVYVPPNTNTNSRPYRGSKFWDDQSWSDSNFIPTSSNSKQMYIPVNKVMHNEYPYRYYESNGGVDGSKAKGKSSLNGAAINDFYQHYQQDYYSSNKFNDGKPFL